MNMIADNLELSSKMIYSPIDKYCEVAGAKVASRIDEHMSIIIKKKQWWMPGFIYRAVIRTNVEIVTTRL